MGKPVSIKPTAFVNESLCDLCFEEALKIGFEKSSKLTPIEMDSTSIRPCVDGLIKRYKSFSRQYKGSVFTMLRDVSWHWASFCETNTTLSEVSKQYFILLRDLTEKYTYIDLEERLDIGKKIKEVGYRGHPLNIVIPREAHGIIADCGTAIGIPFSLMYQVGLGWSLSGNNRQIYSDWSKEIFQPLFKEVIEKAEKRLDDFLDIRDSITAREVRKLSKSLQSS